MNNNELLPRLPLTTETGDFTIIKSRVSKPWTVFRVWSVIISLEAKNKAATLKAVNKSKWKSLEQFEKWVRTAVEDELIQTRGGILAIRRKKWFRNQNEWYCFRCFNPGKKMFKCSGCVRVYHEKCLCPSTERKKCFYCEDRIQSVIRKKKLEKKDISEVLHLILQNVKSKFGSIVEKSELKNENELLVKHLSKLLCHPRFNFSNVEGKIESNKYKSLFEFERDCRNIQYNLCVLYGPRSHIGVQSRKLCEFVTGEIESVDYCAECFVRKNQKLNVNWFLEACDPPHKLCFVKNGKSSPLLAKILKQEEMNERYVISLFDENHTIVTVSYKSLILSSPNKIDSLIGLNKFSEMHNL
ncbi:hypothetical protein B4U79_18084 [Dinothrombium tinctorium]|uniref:Zinc finger MYND domain-containing protein 11-like protein n=1 Tax=Dinothrombium tinctorium TaxID=1965070 RepID=A0A3S3PIS7_9ACAR|nr:hypothetical protein B4U79_18084 [Dinothrombium tinctorium]